MSYSLCLSARVKRIILVVMNWRQKFIVDVVWKYFNPNKYNEYLKRVKDEFYTELQAYLIAREI